MIARRAALGGLLATAACATGWPPPEVAEGPALRPERWFEGRTRSEGVFEDSTGAPTSRFATEAFGRRDGEALLLDQTIRLGDGEVLERSWRLTPQACGRYLATAAPVVGVAEGEARGRLFHWRYVIRLPPGDWLREVSSEHWMVLVSEDVLLNRFRVRKLGLTVARASEVFRRVG